MADILLLGADKNLISRVGSLLRQDRHIVHCLKQVARWREAECERDFDLIVAALHPAERILTTGYRWAAGFPAPILIVQEDGASLNTVHGDDRVIDRITIPFAAENLLAHVDALVRVRRSVRQLRGDSHGGDEAASPSVAADGLFMQFANRVSSLLTARVTGFARPEAPYAGVATRVAAWVDRRDAFEPGHAERVATFASMIASSIGLPKDEVAMTVRAARLHDIGKISLPITVLRQRGPLAEDQRRLIHTRAERGATILHSPNADASLVDTIRYHHARFDGRGRDAAAGRNVPRSARVVAVAEVYDAMTSSQVVPPLPKDAALEQLRRLRGGQLDPLCVDALCHALRPRPVRTQVVARLR